MCKISDLGKHYGHGPSFLYHCSIILISCILSPDPGIIEISPRDKKIKDQAKTPTASNTVPQFMQLQSLQKERSRPILIHFKETWILRSNELVNISLISVLYFCSPNWWRSRIFLVGRYLLIVQRVRLTAPPITGENSGFYNPIANMEKYLKCSLFDPLCCFIPKYKC